MKLFLTGIALLTQFAGMHQHAENKQPVNLHTIPFDNKKIIVHTTAKGTDYRMTPTDTLSFSHMGQPFETQVCVFVDPSKTFQSIIGFGGALTDAAAETFYKLPEASRKELLQAYYDKEKGIGYTMARTNINSCDFSSDSYTYVADNDASLSTFNIDHDRKYKIPLIKEAMNASGNKLNLFVSPWSPPAWMKDNNSATRWKTEK